MSLPPRTFAGATVVLTGAASGMGEQMAYQLAREGADVLIVLDWDAARLDAVTTTLRDRAPSTKIDSHVVDLGDRDELLRVAGEISRAHERIDLLINNAGVSMFGRFDEMTLEDFDFVTNINLRAPIALTHTLLPNLKAAPGSHIINLSSLFGLIAPGGQSPYCTAKFGLRGFSESIGVELESEGIGVTTIHPGGVRTRIATSGRAAAGIGAQSHEHGLALADRLLRMPPEKAAHQILEGARRRKTRVVVGWDAKVVELLPRLAPGAMRRVLRRADPSTR